MNCEVLCLSCNFTQLFKVNYAYYHGLCESHKSSIENKTKCIHCQSIVPILFLSEVNLCVNCFSFSQTTFKNCSHNACENCYLKECSKCSTLCNYCLKTIGVKFENCSHLLCNDCLLYTKQNCPLCQFPNDYLYDFCEYCSENCNDITVKECKHKICKKCSEGLDKCPLCIIPYVSVDDKDEFYGNSIILEIEKGKDIEKIIEFSESGEKVSIEIEGKIENKIKNDTVEIGGIDKISIKCLREKTELKCEDVNKNLVGLENEPLRVGDTQTFICKTGNMKLNSSSDLVTRKKVNKKSFEIGEVDAETLNLRPKDNIIERNFHSINPILTEADDIKFENKSELTNPVPQILKPMSTLFYYITCCLCCGICKTNSHNPSS
ncbi:hypothetical protein SteCoe_4922 [Stentor coeruleus]|uniref:RING-type domain-containing protein n=1 Tax=Stentor coeruleus TaxID=5963 RepID=A0A1R2CTL8_9CILI|nr:hypothetical protein SteCoe_4922 [Stentor coeruleus]